MSAASLRSIKVTSHVAHTVTSAVRGVAASILGVHPFQDGIANGHATSVAIILIGSTLYTWVEYQGSLPALALLRHRVRTADVETGEKP